MNDARIDDVQTEALHDVATLKLTDAWPPLQQLQHQAFINR